MDVSDTAQMLIFAQGIYESYCEEPKKLKWNKIYSGLGSSSYLMWLVVKKIDQYTTMAKIHESF